MGDFMSCRISELRDKQVVCVNSGITLGPVCDVEVDTKCGRLVSIVIFGRCRYFGMFGKEDDIIIPWEEIKVIGPDTVLVGIQPPERGRRGAFLKNKFFNF